MGSGNSADRSRHDPGAVTGRSLSERIGLRQSQPAPFRSASLADPSHVRLEDQVGWAVTALARPSAPLLPESNTGHQAAAAPYRTQWSGHEVPRAALDAADPRAIDGERGYVMLNFEGVEQSIMVDIEGNNTLGVTSLMWRAWAGASADVIRLLGNPKCDLHAKDVNGNNALIWVAKAGGTQVGQLLIFAGADVDAKNKFGNTALMMAVFHKREAMTALLLKAGADVFAQNNAENSAIDIVLRQANNKITQAICDHCDRLLAYNSRGGLSEQILRHPARTVSGAAFSGSAAAAAAQFSRVATGSSESRAETISTNTAIARHGPVRPRRGELQFLEEELVIQESQSECKIQELQSQMDLRMCEEASRKAQSEELIADVISLLEGQREASDAEKGELETLVEKMRGEERERQLQFDLEMEDLRDDMKLVTSMWQKEMASLKEKINEVKKKPEGRSDVLLSSESSSGSSSSSSSAPSSRGASPERDPGQKEQLRARMQEMEAIMMSAFNEVQALKGKLDAVGVKMDTERAAATAEEKRLEEERREIQNQMEQALVQISRMHKEKDEKQAAQADLKTKIDKMAQDVERGKIDLAKIQDENARMVELEAGLQQKMDQARSLEEALRLELAELQAQKAQQEENEKALMARIQSLQEEADRERAAKGESEKEREELKERIEVMLAEKESKKAELASLRAEKEERQRAEAELQERVQAIEKQAMSEREELARVRGEREAKQRAEEELGCKMGELRAQQASMAAEMEEMREQLAEANRAKEEALSKAGAAQNSLGEEQMDFMDDKERLLEDYEEQHKKLERHQRLEKERQERHLQQLIETKKQKRLKRAASERAASERAAPSGGV